MSPMHTPVRSVLAVLFAGALLSAGAAAQAWLPSSPFPAWAANEPSTAITLNYDTSLNDLQNGDRLASAIGGLQPGQKLEIGPGTYSINGRMDISKPGTAALPVFIVAADLSNKPVVTRPNANQNCLNMGSNAAARYTCLRGLEITGGSDLLRLYDCSNIWIDQCYIHDGLGVGIPAQTANTDHLYITRNEITNPGPGTLGEGIYLGTDNGVITTSYSVVAYNHIHDTLLSTNGDGIEIKQNSHHNWVLGNVVHDTPYPCILLYGTGGNDQNVVERNLLYRSGDAVLQVQGEAIVRNNVVIGGANGFDSHDHQGTVQNMQFVHNTIINSTAAFRVNHWNGRPGMVLANNVFYSEIDDAVFFGNGSSGVTIAGNVIHGTVSGTSAAFRVGTGLGDFVNASWDGQRIDATPVVGGAIDNRGTQAYALGVDLIGTVRTLPVDPGAVTNAATLSRDVDEISTVTGGAQVLSFDGGATMAGRTYLALGNASGSTSFRFAGFDVPLTPDGWLFFTIGNPNSVVLQGSLGTLDGNGRGTATFALPPLALAGVQFNHLFTVWVGDNVQFVSNPQSVTLR